MKAKERRKAIVTLLLSKKEAISGSVLAERFGVSRQIIVLDIATLKSEGFDILSTHSGYLMKESPLPERVFHVRHSEEDTADELLCIVGLGGTVVDVTVSHKVYGNLSAQLDIYSKKQVEEFLEGVRSGRSSELMTVTGGYHSHTVRAESTEILDRIESELRRRSYLVEV